MSREERIAKMKYLRFEKGWTLEEIGVHCGGISRERVRQLIGNTGHVALEKRRREKEVGNESVESAAIVAS